MDIVQNLEKEVLNLKEIIKNKDNEIARLKAKMIDVNTAYPTENK